MDFAGRVIAVALDGSGAGNKAGEDDRLEEAGRRAAVRRACQSSDWKRRRDRHTGREHRDKFAAALDKENSILTTVEQIVARTKLKAG